MMFELIQVALGKRESLSHIPTQEEWNRLYAEAQKQSIVGIAFEGVQKLPKEQWSPQTLLFEWIGTAESIKQRNAVLDKQCAKLQKRFGEARIRSSILKGQGVAKLYDYNLASLRQPGDIDVYVDCGRERALLFALDCGLKDVKWDYKHLHLDVFRDTEVEVHYRVEVLLNLWKNRKLQRWFDAHTEEIFGGHTDSEITDGASQGKERWYTDGTDFKVVTPTKQFNRFYILLHIYRHFLYEGVGLRQLLDYYFVLRTGHTEITETTEIIATLKEFGMLRFARGVMWIMKEVFALEKSYMICEPLENEGRFILSEVMAGGNFGHYDERLLSDRGGKLQTMKKVVKHNVHLMRHYPSEIVWPPIWFVWHKCWKLAQMIRKGI